VTVGAIAAVLFFSVYFVAVAFLGGINFTVGDLVFHSTTIELPLIGFLVSSLLVLFIFSRIKDSLLLCASKYPHFLIADPGKEATAEHSQFLNDHLLRIKHPSYRSRRVTDHSVYTGLRTALSSGVPAYQPHHP
jgi:hypothetical protein